MATKKELVQMLTVDGKHYCTITDVARALRISRDMARILCSDCPSFTIKNRNLYYVGDVADEILAREEAR